MFITSITSRLLRAGKVLGLSMALWYDEKNQTNMFDSSNKVIIGSVMRGKLIKNVC